MQKETFGLTARYWAAVPEKPSRDPLSSPRRGGEKRLVTLPLACSLGEVGLHHLEGQRRGKGKCPESHCTWLHTMALLNDSYKAL